MISNLRSVDPSTIDRGLRRQHPDGVTVAWSKTGDDGADVPGGGDFDGLQLPDGRLLVSTAYRLVPTAADLAASAAEAAARVTAQAAADRCEAVISLICEREPEAVTAKVAELAAARAAKDK